MSKRPTPKQKRCRSRKRNQQKAYERKQRVQLSGKVDRMRAILKKIGETTVSKKATVTTVKA